MKRWFLLVPVICLAMSSASFAQRPDEADDDWDVSPVGPVLAGQLEINPIMSFRMSGGGMVYQVGASVGYSLTRYHQLGGSFVMGNRLYTRTNRRQPVIGQDTRIGGPTTGNFSVDQGFWSSLTGFYRFNAPYEVSRRTYPHLEVFAGRDFGWGNLSEVGAALGFRRFISKSTALTSPYSYVLLFAEGDNLKRHVITAGFTVFLQ